jgi:RNA polymerase sigma factor (sigma-70 family)
MDRGLVERAQRGDHRAFEQLAMASASRLDVVARLITRDPERASDAVQDTLVRAWRDLPTLRDPDRFEAWLRRLLVHACMDVLRRARRWSVEVELADVHSGERDITTNVGDRDAIERAYGRLNPDLRAIIVLHYYQDLTLPDVAEALGVAEGTVKSRLHRALGEMRLAIAPPSMGRVNSAGEQVR